MYIINFARNCISPTRSVVYHHCESDTTYGWWYTPAAMIYTLKRDDMPLLSQWINKKGTFGRQKFLFCWRRERDSNPRVLAHKLISSQPRYDHFDISPYEILLWKHIDLKIKLISMSASVANNACYDRFDISPYYFLPLFGQHWYYTTIRFILQ